MPTTPAVPSAALAAIDEYEQILDAIFRHNVMLLLTLKDSVTGTPAHRTANGGYAWHTTQHIIMFRDETTMCGVRATICASRDNK